MKYNQLRNSDLKASEICLGTMTFGQRAIVPSVAILSLSTITVLIDTIMIAISIVVNDASSQLLPIMY